MPEPSRVAAPPPSSSRAADSSRSGYVTLMELASGGMGRVFLAMRRQAGFERLYAIKRPKAEVADDSRAQRMFFAEARLAGLIRHPNAVSVLDVGEDAEGPFLVMDWVEGVSLSRFNRVATEIGPTGIALSCRIIAAAARGLDASHVLYTADGQRLELVHRDVSPQNILLAFDGTVRVTDFGIAKALGRGTGTDSLLLKGKLRYISPEQIRFEPLDRRADLYSLGVVLFETLTGRGLYRHSSGEMEALVHEVVHATPPGLGEFRRDAPPELEDLLYALLAKRPEERPDTARDVADRLEAIATMAPDADESLEALLADRFGSERDAMRSRIAAASMSVSRDGPPSNPRRRWGRWRLGLVAVAAVVIGAAAVAFGLLGGALAGEDERPTPVFPADVAGPAPTHPSPSGASLDPRAADSAETAAAARGNDRERHQPAEAGSGAGVGPSASPTASQPAAAGRSSAGDGATTGAAAAEGPHRRSTPRRRRSRRLRPSSSHDLPHVPAPGEGGWH